MLEYVVYVVYVVVVLVVLWILVKAVMEVRAVGVQYVNLVDYLLGKGAKRVVLVLPRWFRCVIVRLYDKDGMFIEELVMRGEVQCFVGVMASKLRREGFEVEVVRA